MKHLSIDIETVGLGKQARDFVMENTTILYGNIKDPEKREAKKNATIEKLSSQLGLRWFTGKVISIAINDVITNETQCFYGDNESELLNHFNTLLNGCDHVKLYGKNISTFDVPFIIGRMMANKIIPSKHLKDRFKVEDVDTYFGFSSQSNQRGKLSEYCFGLGVDGKGDMDGSQVQPLYDMMIMSNDPEQESLFWNKIKEYNINDTILVSNIVKAYRGDEIK